MTQTQTFNTETQTFVVKGADASVLDHFDFDELLAIGYALRNRAEVLADRAPLYGDYLNAIADKLDALSGETTRD